jgi:DNA polymerase III subunit epsilon
VYTASVWRESARYREVVDASEDSGSQEPTRATDWTHGPLLAFDLETTGVDPYSARPVSYAFVRYEDGVAVETAYELVNPEIPIPAETTSIHHITDEMVRDDGLPLNAAISACCSRLCAASAAGVPVVGMVVGFDLTLIANLDRGFGHCGLRPPNWNGPVLDISVIDRRLDKWRKGRRTLGDLCREYGVDTETDQMHNAASDAALAVSVLQGLSARYPVLAKTDLETLTRRQAEHHRENLIDLNEYRQRRGQPGISQWEIDAPWPVALRAGQ